jgi:5-methyltetrahydropteroyltriglutamate--homocysteine methyltransferase
LRLWVRYSGLSAAGSENPDRQPQEWPGDPVRDAGSVTGGSPPFRAEHVGSLLRPRGLKDAAVAHHRGEVSSEEYHEVLDRSVADAVALQEECGLHVVTDGEFGRTSWFGFFFERLDGFSVRDSLFDFHDDAGNTFGWQTAYCDGPMRRRGPIAVEEFERLAAATRRTPKANLPSPSVLHFFRGDDCRDPAVYPDIDAWWADLVAIYRAEIADLAAAGCRYLQLDEVPLAMLCDESVRARLTGAGIDPEGLAAAYVDVTNRILEGRPADMVVGMHLCRGNFRSRWMASGGYEPVAERLFGDLDVDAFFLEYDSERAGDFRPLRHVRPDTTVVLGLVSTKHPDLEDTDALLARIDEAAAIVDADHLALSPQCGFASVAGGNTLSEADQKAKLRLVVSTATRAWGTAG